MPRNPSCSDCELHEGNRNRCIWGHGDGPGFIIGEAPGAVEARTGRPFQGESGQLLRAELAKHGLAGAYITNVAKCRPSDNDKPTAKQVKACSKYLKEELETRKPKAVLLLGNIATKALLRKAVITQINGQVIEKDSITYVPCVHPAYVLRDPGKMSMLQMALGKYADVLSGTARKEEKIDWKTLKLADFPFFREEWLAAKQASFDIESTGLEWWKPGFRVNCISFSLHPGRTWVLPLSIFPDTEGVGGKLLMWLAQNPRPFHVSQNGKFDNLALQTVYGIRFRNDFDTMLASHLLDENSEHDLKSLARIHLDAPDYALTAEEKKGKGDPYKLLEYNAKDAYYTLKLAQLFEAELKEDAQLYWIFYQLSMPAARAFEDIETNGLYVNIPLLERMGIEERTALARSEQTLNRMAGKRINWNSPKQVADILYVKFRLPVTVYTKKKAPSTGEEALSNLDHPIVDLLLKHREHVKFLGTYIEGWRDFMEGPHLYLSTNLHGTVTGRYSSRLHQVPRDGRIRSCITAPRGWVFVQGDFNQAELRVAAIIAREPELLQCYREGTDVHWRTLMNSISLTGEGEYVELAMRTAKNFNGSVRDIRHATEILMKTGPEKCEKLDMRWKDARKVAKSENFGFLYGMFPKKYVKYAKMKYGFTPTLSQATSARDVFFSLYQALPDWHDRQRKLVRLDGQVRNLIGRIRRLPAIYSRDFEARGEAEREAINAPVQGFVGDLKAMALVEIHETFPRTQLRIVGEVHDSILMWIKNESIRSLLPRIKQIMEHPKLLRRAGIEFSVPIVADLEIGPWGAGKKWANE